LSAALALLLAAAGRKRSAHRAEGAQVRGLLGRAKYSTAGGPFADLKGGTVLHAGDLIQTASVGGGFISARRWHGAVGGGRDVVDRETGVTDGV
jgi:hypothetical protein